MSEPDTNIPVEDPAEFAKPWRWLSLATAGSIAVLVAFHRLDLSDPWAAPSLILLALELAPLFVIATLVRSGARKRIVVAMLLAMTYVAHAALIASSPGSRVLGSVEFLLALALFGSLFVIGRALLAEERRLNP